MSVFTASLDDIVFEGRNRAYGAYQLRQSYQSTLASAGGLTLGLCALVLAGWLAWPAAKPQVVQVTPGILVTTPVPPPTIIEKPKAAPPAAPAARVPAAAHAVASLPTHVVQDNQVTKPTTIAEPSDLAELMGPTGPTAASGSIEVPGGVPGGMGTEATAAPAAPAEPFTYVEKMPEFAGGQAALLRYLREHLRYPSQALREGQEGRVFMSFVVGVDGQISEVQVLKGLGYGLDEEALRVVRQMPAWTPGYQSHHAVPVRFTLPISFQLR